MHIALIAAMSENGVIGNHNALPWHLPEELEYFREKTRDKPVIMGRKTFESIGRPLPNRQNIIVSRNGAVGVEGTLTAASLETAYDLAQFDVCVIGGGEIYRQAISDMDTLYVTEVEADFPQASVFFPEIDPALWQESSREHHPSDDKNKYAFDFVTYVRTAPVDPNLGVMCEGCQ